MIFFRSWIKSLVLFMSIVVLDRFTKMAAMTLLASQGSYVVAPWLSFSLALNRGISWSLLWSESAAASALLSGGILIIILLFLGMTVREFWFGRSIIAQVCVLGGAVSNLVDRFLYGGVIDFIDVHWGDWHFATFNVADSFIVLAVLFLIKKVMIDDAKNQ